MRLVGLTLIMIVSKHDIANCFSAKCIIYTALIGFPLSQIICVFCKTNSILFGPCCFTHANMYIPFYRCIILLTFNIRGRGSLMESQLSWGKSSLLFKLFHNGNKKATPLTIFIIVLRRNDLLKSVFY